MTDILVVDTEHGGFVPNATLLSLYMGVFNSETDELKHELGLLIKPDDGAYIVNAEALGVNKINLVEHDKTAVSYTSAATHVKSFLAKISDDGKKRVDVLGHNVAGDISIIVDRLLSGRDSVWTRHVNYRTLDTGTISRFLVLAGKLPQGSAGLGSLCAIFNITDADHTAKGDVIATYKLFKKLLGLVI